MSVADVEVHVDQHCESDPARAQVHWVVAIYDPAAAGAEAQQQWTVAVGVEVTEHLVVAPYEVSLVAATVRWQGGMLPPRPALRAGARGDQGARAGWCRWLRPTFPIHEQRVHV